MARPASRKPNIGAHPPAMAGGCRYSAAHERPVVPARSGRADSPPPPRSPAMGEVRRRPVATDCFRQGRLLPTRRKAGAMLAAQSLLLWRGALRSPDAAPREEAQRRPRVRTPAGRIICLRPTWELSAGTADALVQTVGSRVRAATPPAGTVVLDLCLTRAIDDDTRRALRRLHRLLAHSQARLRLVHPAAAVRATLTIGGPIDAISPKDVHGSLREALLAAHASLPGPALVTPATRRFLTEPPEPLSLP